MSAGKRHIIRKLTLQVRQNDPQQAGTAIHDRYARLLTDDVLSAVETLFDRVSGNGNHIRLDRLEIDLGAIEASRFEVTFKERLLQHLEKSLQGKIARENETITRPAATSPTDIYLYFLATGRFPWWAEHHSLDALEAELLQTEVPASFTDACFTLFQKDAQALIRFVRQAGERLRAVVWREKTGYQLASRPVKSLARRIASGKSPEEIERLLWETAMLLLPAQPFPTPAHFKTALDSLLHRKEGERAKKVSGPDTPPAPALPSGEVLYAPNSGLVLLNPFLQMFFREVGLLDEKDFKDDDSRMCAVQWLHYLATGKLNCPEPELIFPKILCAAPLNMPVERRFQPQAGMLAEAETMLTSVVRHWGAIKNTSPDGLREGFLQRNGKLTSGGGGWRLNVERHSQDILLEQLPWTISIVKLPWMPGILMVEW